jgi:hypothetical protein
MTDRELGDDRVYFGDDGIYRRREDREPERLANVTVAVVANVVWHERAGIRHTLELDVALNGEVWRIGISPDDSERLRFVDALFGARTIVGPVRDARRAIAHALRVKAAAPMRCVYTILGWQKGLFVGGGGVIPPDPVVARVIAVPPLLRVYDLAVPATPDEARAVLGAMLAIVTAAPAPMTVLVLLALVAPLTAAGGGVHLVGDRGDCAALATPVGQFQGVNAADAVLDRPDNPLTLDAFLGSAPYHALPNDCPEPEDTMDARHAERLIAVLHTPAPGRAAVITSGGPPPRGAAWRAALTRAVPPGTARACSALRELIDDGALARAGGNTRRVGPEGRCRHRAVGDERDGGAAPHRQACARDYGTGDRRGDPGRGIPLARCNNGCRHRHGGGSTTPA